MTAEIIDMKARGCTTPAFPPAGAESLPEFPPLPEPDADDDTAILLYEARAKAIARFIEQADVSDEISDYLSGLEYDCYRRIAELPASMPDTLVIKARLVEPAMMGEGCADWDRPCFQSLLDDLERFNGNRNLDAAEMASCRFDALFSKDILKQPTLSEETWLGRMNNMRVASIICTDNDADLERMVRDDPATFQEVRNVLAPTKQDLMDAIAVLNVSALRLSVVFARLDGLDGAP